ncbi:uncharacterized protein BJ212DRAFT_1483817 [Suillus subaureus]|uniref:Uncharacterized protein n=1 Tax=Suillus subaureus TaxID=48587 RepID=A0A9P7E596_9AGAM|nr:uncharacterized protein BJ212DRAFT_1483817 [Suillus subaureus]KAG1811152.1 hypothetical protein BJ212DRAFT_1483817 [Suillus subaureus]
MVNARQKASAAAKSTKQRGRPPVNKSARTTQQQIKSTAGVAEDIPAPAIKPKPTPRAVPKRVHVLPPKSPVSSDSNRHAIELETAKNEAAAILAGMADSGTVNEENDNFFTNLDDLALGEPEIEQQFSAAAFVAFI